MVLHHSTAGSLLSPQPAPQNIITRRFRDSLCAQHDHHRLDMQVRRIKFAPSRKDRLPGPIQPRSTSAAVPRTALSQSFATTVGQLYVLDFDTAIFGSPDGTDLMGERQVNGTSTSSTIP
jgi:hypothetical protein